MADAAHHGSASNFRAEAEPSRLQAQALASLGVPLGPTGTIARLDRLNHATGPGVVSTTAIGAPGCEGDGRGLCSGRKLSERPRPVSAALVDLPGDGRV